MPLNRAMLCLLIAVAIVFAPMARAWAGAARAMGTGMGVSVAHTVAHDGDGQDQAHAAPMEDCASMKRGAAGTEDCPCCDNDKACLPQLCMAKCFQLLGLSQPSRPLANAVTARLRPMQPAHPPDWSDQPQPPPPRT